MLPVRVLPACFALVHEPWRPHVVASANEQELKVFKAHGEFPWHLHEQEDELFVVWKGEVDIETRERTYRLGAGEVLVIPRQTEHRVVARAECEILLFEPTGVRNTGNIVDDVFTAPVNRF